MQESAKKRFLEATEACPVIPEVKNDEWLNALPESDSGIAYIVYGDICSIADIVDRVKAGWEFLLPYYDYFVTLDGDPDPSSEEIPLRGAPTASQ